MKDKLIEIVPGIMSEQPIVPEARGSTSAPVVRGSRARPLRQDETEHAQLLLSLFEKHLLGTRANGPNTVKIALGALRTFARFVGRPPWEWVEQDLDEFLAHKVTSDDIGLGRQSTYITYLRGFQSYMLNSVGLKNEIQRRFGASPQRFVTPESAIPIKRKRHERKQEIRPLSAEQCAALIVTFDHQIDLAQQCRSKAYKALRRDKAMVMLMLLTGIRVEELVKIKVTDWMSDAAQSQFGDCALLSVAGKGRKRRVVRLFNPLIRELMDWYMLEVRPAFLRIDTAAPDLLFFSERGQQLCTEQVRRMLRNIAALAGIPFRVKPHMLRHTYATQMKEIIGAEALQRQLGHEYLSTTLGTYYHQNAEATGNEVAQGISNMTESINRMTAEIAHEDHS